MSYKKGAIIERKVVQEKKKRKKSKYSEAELLLREELIKNHKTLLLLIYKIGNKVMLETQLIRLCKNLRLKDYQYSDSTINKVLEKMKNVGLVEIERWQSNKRCKVIELREPASQYCTKYFENLLGYPHSSYLSTDESRFSSSICRAEYIIEKLHPNIIKSRNLDILENFFQYIDKNYSMYYQKNRGDIFLNNLVQKNKNSLKLSDKDIEEIEEYNIDNFQNLVSRTCNAVITSIKNEYVKLSENKYDVPFLKQNVTVKIDVFDMHNKKNLDSLLISAVKSIDCYNHTFSKKLTLCGNAECNKCEYQKDCIYVVNSAEGLYQKFNVNCKQNLYVLDRKIEYVINIYSYDESGLINLKVRAEKEKTSKSGEKQGVDILEYELSKKTKVNFNNITVNFKSLDIDRKYIKGRRGETFQAINEERRLANMAEFEISQSKNTSKKEDEEIKAFIKDINSLPVDARSIVIENFREALKSSLNAINIEKEEI